MISHMPALLLRCLLCTVIIECAAAFILGLRKPDEQLTVALVNVVTNPLLVSICILVQLFYSKQVYWCVYIGLELAVFIGEALLYRAVLRRKRDPFLLSAILNSASFFIGMLLNRYFF